MPVHLWKRAATCGLVLGVLLVATPGRKSGEAAAPLARGLTAEQVARLKERDRWLREAIALYRAGKAVEAIKAAEKMLAIERRALGDIHEEIAVSLEMLAQLHEGREDFAAAVKARQEVLAIRTKLHGPGHWRGTDARWALATTERLRALDRGQRRDLLRAALLHQEASRLYSLGKAEVAQKPAREALALRKAYLGERHPDYALSLNNLAVLYQKAGAYAKALPLYEQARDIRKAALGEGHPSYATSLNNLAMLHRELSDYGKALPLCEKARDVSKAAFGERHPSYAGSLNNLAALYQNVGDHAKALPLYEQACDVSKATLGERHPNYATCLNNLAALYRDMGDYGKALTLYEQARDIRKAALGERHPAYPASLNDLAALYRDMGDTGKALSLCVKARDLRKAVLGERHPDYATSLNNLAALYQNVGDHAKALPLYEQALALYKAVLGERHPSYANGLNNLAMLHCDMGDYAKALPLCEQARVVYKVAFDERHPNGYANSLNNLALIHQCMGNYAKALPLYEQARDLGKAALGERHPEYANSLNNLAMLHFARNECPRAEALFHQGLTIQHQHLETTFSALTERQRLDLLAKFRFNLDIYLSIASAAEAPPARLYEQVLAWKGIVAAHHAEQRLAFDQPTLRPLLDDLRLARAGLAKLAASPPSPAKQALWRQRFDDLERTKEALEVKLANASKEFRRLREQRQLTAEQVTKALPEGTALVDFLRYTLGAPHPTHKGHWQSEECLLAFVLAKGRPLVCLQLGAAGPVERLVQAWLRPVSAERPAPPEPSVARELRGRLWLPLQKHLGGATTVLIAPDAGLCALPFAALPGSKPGSFLLEEVALGQVTSGRHLLELSETAPAGEGLLALGGPDYGPAPTRSSGEGARARFQPWQPLPGTALEVEQIANLFRAAFPRGAAPRLLTGGKADAASLRTAVAEGKRWRYLHLATHGFFEPPHSAVPAEALAALTAGAGAAPQVGAFQALATVLAAEEPGALDRQGHTLDLSGQSSRTLRRNPLLLSGLVLAGANNSAAGLLSAEEVAGLDLRGCDLAVLSACETGLGKVAGGEGVLGLQRAFHQAGARSLVTSLWGVSDAATSVLMEEFYANLWMKKLSRREALRQAQLTVLRKPALVEARRVRLRAVSGLRGPGRVAVLLPDGGKIGEPRRSNPAYWAAFVLSGDGR